MTGDLAGQEAQWLCRALVPLLRCDQSCAPIRDGSPGLSRAGLAAYSHLQGRGDIREIRRSGRGVARLLDPGSAAGALLRDLLGPDARTLASARGTGGRNITEEDLVVERFGDARRWRERDRHHDEGGRTEWGVLTGDLYLNDAVFLSHVPRPVWRYEMGGYPVVKKWLGYREARRRQGWALTLGELAHLRGIIHRIAALLTLRPAADNAYEQATPEAWLSDELTE